jgi:hypothetical protein
MTWAAHVARKEGGEKCVQGFGTETMKGIFGRPRRRWQGVDWVYMAQDRDR